MVIVSPLLVFDIHDDAWLDPSRSTGSNHIVDEWAGGSFELAKRFIERGQGLLVEPRANGCDPSETRRGVETNQYRAKCRRTASLAGHVATDDRPETMLHRDLAPIV